MAQLSIKIEADASQALAAYQRLVADTNRTATEVGRSTEQMSQATGRATAKMAAGFGDLQAKMQQTGAAAAQAAAGFTPIRQTLESIEQATRTTARASTVMAQQLLESSRTAAVATQDLAQKTRQSTAEMSGAYNTVHGSITTLLEVLAGLGLAVSATGLIRGAIETASSFENLDVQLRFLLGSMEKFQQARQFIPRFTAETPLQLADVTKSFTALTRAGLDAQQLLPRLVDVASLQQFPREALNSIVLAITQIADRGKLAGQELIQLSQVGVPIGRVREE